MSPWLQTKLADVTLVDLVLLSAGDSVETEIADGVELLGLSPPGTLPGSDRKVGTAEAGGICEQ